MLLYILPCKQYDFIVLDHQSDTTLQKENKKPKTIAYHLLALLVSVQLVAVFRAAPQLNEHLGWVARSPIKLTQDKRESV